MGDCTTIERPRLISKFKQLFQEEDKDNRGFLTKDQFHHLIKKYSPQYPQLEYYGKKLNELFDEFDVNKDHVLQLDEFEKLLQRVVRIVPYYFKNFNYRTRKSRLYRQLAKLQLKKANIWDTHLIGEHVERK